MLAHLPNATLLTQEQVQTVMNALWYYVVMDGEPVDIVICNRNVPRSCNPKPFKPSIYHGCKLRVVTDAHILYPDGTFGT